jgi:hypothetical protein
MWCQLQGALLVQLIWPSILTCEIPSHPQQSMSEHSFFFFKFLIIKGGCQFREKKKKKNQEKKRV